MLTSQDLRDQRELIQDDITCVLDGVEQAAIDAVCDVVVERFNILLDKLWKKNNDQVCSLWVSTQGWVCKDSRNYYV